jgi:hypothetical protein
MEAKILNELVISHVNLDEIDLLVLLLFDWAGDIVISISFIY